MKNRKIHFIGKLFIMLCCCICMGGCSGSDTVLETTPAEKNNDIFWYKTYKECDIYEGSILKGVVQGEEGLTALLLADNQYKICLYDDKSIWSANTLISAKKTYPVPVEA